jgi:hypothetical protein
MEEFKNISYANDNALEVAKWALEEFDAENRIKASKLKRVADKMEDKYRDTREYKTLVQATKINKKMGYGVSAITYRKLSR